MPLNIRDEEVNRLATELASLEGLSKTAAVKLAIEEKLDRIGRPATAAERIKAIQDRLRAYPKTGLEADKAFYDSLNDE